MKNHKKILCIALGLVCLAACGDDDDDTILGTDNTGSSTVRGTEQISFIGTVYVNDEETSSDVEVLVETNKRTNTCSVYILNASIGGNSPVIPVIKVEDLEMNDGA
ncbi:MAG: hypothetical protein IJ748_07950, partial [Bacteroidales bacterium]|nr:hypothetical protein [Bacteroidales bacterium]